MHTRVGGRGAMVLRAVRLAFGAAGRARHASSAAAAPYTAPPVPPNMVDAMTIIAKDFMKMTPGPKSEDVLQLLLEARNERELRKVVHDIAMQHPLFLDPLNGHGYRVAVFSRVLQTAVRIGEIDLVYDILVIARSLAFVLTRTYAAVILDIMKHYINQRFIREGRNPNIVEVVLRRCRQLRVMCLEDRVPYDFVMHSRELHIAASLVAVFDRQNLYRSSFPADDVPRREGVIVDWVVAHQRCVDFDWAIEMTRPFVAETVARVKDANTRPHFSFMKRLGDYRFATDDFDGMLAVVEECHAQGIDVVESSIAKLLQLASAFNVRDTPQLTLKYRAATSHCMLAAPDVGRVLGFYARGGGGQPCPECGEPYNHRNPSIDVWSITPAAMKQCTLFQQAQTQRGVYEDNPGNPCARDWSAVAFAMLELSEERSIVWTNTEWRMFLLCITFSPRAVEGLNKLLQQVHRSTWDEFLAMTAVRLLRFNAPERIVPLLQEWQGAGFKLSPLPLQQAVKGQVLVEDPAARVDGLRYLADVHEANEVYATKYATRILRAHLEALPSDSREERRQLQRLIKLAARTATNDVKKDSVTDVAMGMSKRHQIYDFDGYAPRQSGSL